MKKEADVEMLPEYDFSGGVRGKHAARFTPAERDELIRRAAMQDVQSWTANALLRVQELEAVLFAYLLLAEKRSPEQAGAEAEKLFGGELSGPLSQRLTAMAKERDWLVHRSRLSTRGQVVDLLERLEHASSEASGLKSEIDALVSRHLSQDGLSRQEIITRMDETFNLWLAA